MRDIY